VSLQPATKSCDGIDSSQWRMWLGHYGKQGWSGFL